MTTILIKKKDTAGVPAPGDLTNSAGGAEIAVNTSDLKIYTKNSGGTIVQVGSGPSATDTLTNKSISGSTNTITNVSLTTGVTGTLPVANGGTGITSFGAGVATFLATPSSANLAAAVTNETGSGALVFATSPTLVTPALGTPSSATLTNATGLPTAGLVDNAVTDAKLRDSAALSVIGRSANSSGDPADIAAATDHQVLRRSGTALAFGSIALNQAAAVTGALPVANGGTGSTTAVNAKIALAVITAATGSAVVPAGTTAERNGSPSAGNFRFNTTLSTFEGYNGSVWGAIAGGGATGGGSNAVFYENDQTVTTNYTITTNKNAMTAGPITINSGITVTVPTDSVWTIV